MKSTPTSSARIASSMTLRITFACASGAATLVSAQRPIDWNIAAAVGVVTVIIFSLLVQRYIVRGLTAGAVK